MKHSCGAIIYSYEPITNKIGIILGLEGYHWLPFKGCTRKYESYEDAAKREIYEETCRLVNIDKINLEHNFNSKNKYYHIGLVYANYNIIEKFRKKRIKEDNIDFMEKKKIKFFPLKNILTNKNIHYLTKSSISFYWERLILLSNGNVLKNKIRPRNYSTSILYNNKLYNCSYIRKNKNKSFKNSKKVNMEKNWRRY